MSPPLYLLFNTVFISLCVNTVLSAHTVLCKLFKYSSGRTQTSFSPETSRGEPRHSQRQEQLFFSKLQSHGCWERGRAGGGRQGRGGFYCSR